MTEPTQRMLPANYEKIGDATVFVDRIHSMLDKIELFEGFDRAEIRLLARFMAAYHVPAGAEIIREGEPGDYLLLMIEGNVDVFKNDRGGNRKRIAIIGPGTTLGEMSMIDGAPRFSTCVAATQATFTMLTREDLTRIIADQPMLGAKILMQLVVMLSQRLRQTSDKLVNYLDQ